MASFLNSEASGVYLCLASDILSVSSTTSLASAFSMYSFSSIRCWVLVGVVRARSAIASYSLRRLGGCVCVCECVCEWVWVYVDDFVCVWVYGVTNKSDYK